MTTPSAFQTLPLHIAERIACYCIYSRLERGDILGLQRKRELVWSVLYRVNSYWRELALKHLLSEADINVFIEDGSCKQEYPRLPDDISVYRDYNSYVGRISVYSAYESYLPNEGDFRHFSLPWPKDLIFPLARHLFVDISEVDPQMCDRNSGTEREMFCLLVQHILMAMPKLQRVTLSGFTFERQELELSSDYPWKADGLLSIIFETLKLFTLTRENPRLLSDNMPAQNIMGLTQVEYKPMDGNDVFAHIIRKSASTLESLHYIDSLLSTVEYIIFDEEDEPVVYSRLRRLAFNNSGELTRRKNFRVSKNVALFPALQFLQWDSKYIFDDDALFRGNNSTLEYLDIRASTGLIDILQRYKTFDNGKYSRLSHVSVRNFNNAGEAENDALFTKLGASIITPATISLSLYNARTHDVNRILAESRYLENIQILEFSGHGGTVRELITLIKLLPGMTTLRCYPGCIGFGSNSKRFSKFINDIYKNSYPISRRFRRWEFIKEYDADVYSPAETALAFAILCTDFTLAYIPPTYKSFYVRGIEEFIASGQNDRHIGKVRRLFRITDRI